MNRDSESESADQTASVLVLDLTCPRCGNYMWKKFRDSDAVPDRLDWKCTCGEEWQTCHYKRKTVYRPPKREE